MRLCSLLWFVLSCGGAVAGRAEAPAYFREAFARFHPDVPPGWACTLTTTRGAESSVERGDPSRPLTERWTLLRRNGRPPTPEEIERHRNYRVATSTSALRATFQRGDIDVASVQLVREDAAEAEFRCRFRSDLKDQLLDHLELRLTVRKQPAVVRQYELLLTEPFWPVLGLKMTELRVEMRFAPAAPGGPLLPASATSHFRGRLLLLKTIAEDVAVAYSDYVHTKPEKRTEGDSTTTH